MTHRKRSTVPVDEELLVMAFSEDANYGEPASSGQTTFFDCHTGAFEYVYPTDRDAAMAGIPAEEARRTRHRVKRGPHRYIEVPINDHAFWHEVFRKWLDGRGDLHTYRGTIGGWLKQFASEADRNDWAAHKRDIALELGQTWLDDQLGKGRWLLS